MEGATHVAGAPYSGIGSSQQPATLFKRLRRDLVDIRGEAGLRENAGELFLHFRLSPLVEPLPAPEWGQQTRCHRRVDPVELQHDIGMEGIAGSIGSVIA